MKLLLGHGRVSARLPVRRASVDSSVRGRGGPRLPRSTATAAVAEYLGAQAAASTVAPQPQTNVRLLFNPRFRLFIPPLNASSLDKSSKVSQFNAREAAHELPQALWCSGVQSRLTVTGGPEERI